MMHNLSTTKYSLVSIKLDDKRFKLYTHYEGLQVIDEILLLGQYHLAYRLKPRVVIDVGAHIGIFTVSMAKHIKEVCNNGLIIAIEPVSINYNAMLNNIEINMVKDIVKPIRAAVASKEDYIEVEWIGVRERVKTVTMNRLIEIVKEKGYNYIDLVKIDIEGAELEILTK
jgi:FkbM family methyltransferase